MREDTHEAAKGRGLSGAVGTNQAQHLPGRDGKRQVVNSREIPEELGQMMDFDHGPSG
jgi:hypothetical protein